MGELARISTGIDGLDTILRGGLIERQNVLIRGPPGVGKTVFCLHFLAAEAGDEGSVYINLGEPTAYVKQIGDAFGLDVDRIRFLELGPTESRFSDVESYTLFSPADVEQPTVVSAVRETVEDVQPSRVVIDPITEFRYLTADDHQFRTQILGLIDFLKSNGATVLMTSQASPGFSDSDLQFLTDVVVDLDLAEETKTVDVTKFRGPPVMRGPHTFEIAETGISVWPQLQPPERTIDYPIEKLSSGVPELDQLLTGGIDRGTVTFFSGPTGAGKTTISMQFVQEAASRGTKSLILSFEESRRTLLQRSEALNIPLATMLDNEMVDIVEIRPQSYAVDQLVDIVQTYVEDGGVELVLLDGLQGFKQNLRGLGDDPTDHLVSLGRYLHDNGITTIVTNEVHNITGEFRVTEEGLSNLADNIVFLRHLEYQGTMQKVIGVLKMRTSAFEKTLRKLDFTEYGISVGEPLEDLQGVLTGTPEWDNGETETDATTSHG